MEAHGFRFSFTPLAGVLFTVPSRYSALSVGWCSVPWVVVDPASHAVLRAAYYSGRGGTAVLVQYATVMLSGRVFQTRSHTKEAVLRRACGVSPPCNPSNATPRSLARCWFGLSPGSFATTAGVVHSSSGYVRCFSWPGSLHDGASSDAGCPIRRPLDQCVLAAPQCISVRGPVLRRHQPPRHPPCAHSVFAANVHQCAAGGGLPLLPLTQLLPLLTAVQRAGSSLSRFVSRVALHLVRCKCCQKLPSC